MGKSTRYEIYAPIYSDVYRQTVNTLIGVFDSIVNARLFVKAYEDKYKTICQIVETR